MTARLELVGKRFERLVAIRDVGRNKRGSRLWLCKCDCGNEVTVIATKLSTGWTRSCGCLQRDRVTKHGMHSTPIYYTWQGMIQRCTNPNSPTYKHYGKRGIAVCSHWRDFTAFYEDMGPRPDKLTLDRIDNDGGYWCGHCQECLKNNRPANCRWVTQAENLLNSRHVLDSLAKKCRQHNINYGTAKSRIGMGWSLEDALTKPTRDDSFPRKCRERDLDPETVRARLGRGWSLERALDTPVK